MAKKKLYAKDRRKLRRRRWTSVALTVGGGAALVFFGWYLYRKIVADAAPAPGQQKDWSGCLEPPDWVQPRPRFSCGDHVAYEAARAPGGGSVDKATGDYEWQNVTSYITGRSWSQGIWVYETMSDSGLEESNLQSA